MGRLDYMQIVEMALYLKSMFIEGCITRDEYVILIRCLEDQYNILNPRDD